MRTDLLDLAAGALRETGGGAAGARDDATLARVLQDVRRAKRRGRALSTVALSFAIALTGVGAWAATTGRLAEVARRVRGAPVVRGASPARAVSRPRGPEVAPLAARPRGPEVVPLAPPAAPVVAAPIAPAPVPAPGRRVALLPSAGSPSRAPARAPVEAVAPSPSPDALYSEAREAHFVRRDFAASLALWDRYLALSPLPRFAVEARYNRAIALFRLGRRAETRQALRPFADGDYGSYRAAEARTLLDALAR